MKKYLLLFLFALFSSISQAQTPHTQLTGTLNNPDGTGFTGNLYLSISIPTSASPVSPCGGPAQIVPNQSLNISIQNGSMVSYTVTGSSTVYSGAPKVFGSDCTIPVGVPYNAILKDPQGNIDYSTQWLITGATQNVGTVYQAPQTVPSSVVTQIPGYGAPTNPCTSNTQYLQIDGASGSNVWPCVNGQYVQQTGTAGTIAINSIVNGSIDNAVLYVGPSGVVANDSDFTYITSTHTLGLYNLTVSQPIVGGITGNAATATKLLGVPSQCTGITVSKGVDQYGNAQCVTPSGGITGITVATANGFQGSVTGTTSLTLHLNVDSTHYLPLNTSGAGCFWDGTGACTPGVLINPGSGATQTLGGCCIVINNPYGNAEITVSSSSTIPGYNVADLLLAATGEPNIIIRNYGIYTENANAGYVGLASEGNGYYMWGWTTNRMICLNQSSEALHGDENLNLCSESADIFYPDGSLALNGGLSVAASESIIGTLHLTTTDAPLANGVWNSFTQNCTQNNLTGYTGWQIPVSNCQSITNNNAVPGYNAGLGTTQASYSPNTVLITSNFWGASVKQGVQIYGYYAGSDATSLSIAQVVKPAKTTPSGEGSPILRLESTEALPYTSTIATGGGGTGATTITTTGGNIYGLGTIEHPFIDKTTGVLSASGSVATVSGTATGCAVASNTLTVTAANNVAVNTGNTQSEVVSFSGFTGSCSFLNGVAVPIISQTSTTMTGATGAFSHSNVTATDSGSYTQEAVTTLALTGLTVPVSTTWGNLSAAINPPVVTTGVLTPENIALPSGAPTVSVGQLMQIYGGVYFENPLITAVSSSGGVQTVTVGLYYPHVAGESYCIGGMGGRGAEETSASNGVYIYLANATCSKTSNTVQVSIQTSIGAGQLISVNSWTGPLKFYHMTFVQDVRDASSNNVVTGVNLTLWPNDIPFANGDVVENTNNISGIGETFHATYSHNNPFSPISGFNQDWGGSATGAGSLIGGGFGLGLYNQVSSTLYVQGGGSLFPFNNLIMFGQWGGMVYETPPQETSIFGRNFLASLTHIFGYSGTAYPYFLWDQDLYTGSLLNVHLQFDGVSTLSFGSGFGHTTLAGDQLQGNSLLLPGSVIGSGTFTLQANPSTIGHTEIWPANNAVGVLTNDGSGNLSFSSAYAPLASPTFTGMPSAPTAANNTFTTQLATTNYVYNMIQLYTRPQVSTYTTSTSITPSSYFSEWQCNGTGITLTVNSPSTGQTINVVNLSSSASCTVAFSAGIGNSSTSSTLSVASGAAVQLRYDGTYLREE